MFAQETWESRLLQAASAAEVAAEEEEMVLEAEAPRVGWSASIAARFVLNFLASTSAYQLKAAYDYSGCH